MRLTDEQIIDMLIDYIENPCYDQAVLIDGEWGSGKTFFVKEKLQEKLNQKFNGKSVLYISLYGLDDVNQIIDEMYTIVIDSYLKKNLGEEKGQKVKKGLNVISKVVSTGLKHFNINCEELPSLSDMMEIKDVIIIFDDIERCNININLVLGFINNLIEHKDIKVILVANQAEIGTIGYSSDLAYKYLVALNSKLDLNEGKDGKHCLENGCKDSISKEQLDYRTNKLFNDNILYKKIREKLIGITIYYEADLENNYDSIISKYIKDTEVEKQLEIHKKLVLQIFEKKQHRNIRTLIFGIIAYQKIFKIIKFTINFNVLIKFFMHPSP